MLEQNINLALYGTYTPQLSAYDSSSTILNFQNPFAVTLSRYTNRTTIINTNKNVFSLIFDMPDWDSNTTTVCNQRNPYYNDLPLYYGNNKLQPNTMGFQMGFRAIIYVSPVLDTFSGYNGITVVSQQCYFYTGQANYNDSNDNYVFFCVDDFTNNRLDEVIGVFPEFFFNQNVLALVPVQSPHFTSTLNTGADFIFKSRNYTGPVDISKLVVSIYSSNGIKISFNQIPFAFAIQFRTIYENPVATLSSNQLNPPF